MNPEGRRANRSGTRSGQHRSCACSPLLQDWQRSCLSPRFFGTRAAWGSRCRAPGGSYSRMMLHVRIVDSNDRLPQTADGCAIACAAMSLRAIHGMPAQAVYERLRRELKPEGIGVKLHDLAQAIRHLYGKDAQASRHADLSHVLGYGRRGALTIGVRPEYLYEGIRPGALHAVYVAATEHPLDELRGLPPGWRPGLKFTPPPDIVDPEPLLAARRVWTYEDLALAYTGDWMVVPTPPRRQ